MCLLALLTVAVTILMLSGIMYDQFFERMKQEVRTEALYLAAGLNLGGEEYLVAVGGTASNRITLIAPDGQVLYDSEVAVEVMENHGNRPEIRDALARGFGEALRLSETLDKQTFYCAIRLDNGIVLRVANTVASIYATIGKTVPHLFFVAIVVLALATLLARWQTRKIVAPINAIDLDDPTSNVVYDELSPLLIRIAKLRAQIAAQMDILKERQEEFIAITENMREGLIILNAKGNVLAINESAKRLFGVKATDYLHGHLLALNRNLILQNAVEKAVAGTPAREELEIGHRHYQLLANPVWVDKIEKTVRLQCWWLQLTDI